LFGDPDEQAHPVVNSALKRRRSLLAEESTPSRLSIPRSHQSYGLLVVDPPDCVLATYRPFMKQINSAGYHDSALLYPDTFHSVRKRMVALASCPLVLRARLPQGSSPAAPYGRIMTSGSCRSFFSDTSTLRITKSLAEEFRRRYQAGKSLKDSTVNRDLSVLRHILRSTT
jgi:hypothetical protein